MAKEHSQFRGVFDVVNAVTVSVDPAAFSDNESSVLDVSVPGARVGDFVMFAAGVDLAEGVVTAYVRASDIVEVVVAHVGGDTTNLAASNWKFIVMRAAF